MGSLVAVFVIVSWASAQAAWLAFDLPWGWAPAIVLLQTFLHTGLFITAHDAMHGTVAPGHPRWNHLLGRMAVGLYAAFPYGTLLPAHHAHHRAPATPDDPDFHRGHPGFWGWYRDFLGGYLSWPQFLAMAAVYNVLVHLVGVPEPRVIVYWVTPALLSTLQLFYFGTWRPHRTPPGGHTDHHRATSETWPAWAMFLTCWNFGLHHEHHARPGVPWWRLRRAPDVNDRGNER